MGISVAHRHPDTCCSLLKQDIAEYEASFNLRWKADMRAIARWREAHPGNELVLPDHADRTDFPLSIVEDALKEHA